MAKDQENLQLLWSFTDEPHADRRRRILEKHPEVKCLMVTDKTIAVHVSAAVLMQLGMCWLISNLMDPRSASIPFMAFFHSESNFSWAIGLFLLLTYAVGGTINHSLVLSIHEISHNTIFGNSRPLLNRAFGMFANLPIGVPIASSFKKYHVDHHRYLGDERLDGDVATDFEIKYFSSTFGKFLFVAFQPLFYAFRPFYLNPKPMTFQEVVNFVVQISFDLLVLKLFSAWAVVYLVLGTLTGLGIHPISGHFFAEHYAFYSNVDTCSYYGSLNAITYNVGYHVEHHDFPNIPCYLLPTLRRMAPEFYDHLPSYSSWIYVLYSFVMRPDMGPAARTRRKTKLNILRKLD